MGRGWRFKEIREVHASVRISQDATIQRNLWDSEETIDTDAHTDVDKYKEMNIINNMMRSNDAEEVMMSKRCW